MKEKEVAETFERLEDRACAEAIVAKSRSRLELAKSEMRVGLKFVEELHELKVRILNVCNWV